MKKILMAACAAFCLTGQAEVLPAAGSHDARIRVVNYNASNVVRLNTFFGVSTHVQFSQAENIQDVAVGDDLAWQVVPRRNNLFIKPKAKQGDTNITVITNLRTYHFIVTLIAEPSKDNRGAWADRNLTYSLSFRYPDDEQALRDARAAAEAERARKRDVQERLKSAPVKAGHNMDYWVAGHQEVSPTGAYDDGRFIYLTFSSNRDMPAVYEVDSNGAESLVNSHVTSGNTIVIQRMVKSLMLRKGEYVASVLNRSFDRDGGRDNLTGTVANDVERVIKEVQ